MAKKEEETAEQNVKFWVGIGASAGGLEALRGLVRNLSTDLPATYIVAQHMAPHHKSMLSEIIGRETSMPVLEVTEGVKPKRNAIYITPPNQNILVDGDELKLIDPNKKPGAPKPSVDDFFASLSEQKKEFAIGIILSGTGSDGAKGIKAVQEAGGITLAQDEMTAKYASMPQTAIETGCVELVMSPEEIGVQMRRILEMPRNLDSLRTSNLSLDSISELVQLLRDQTRVDFRYYKSATFQRRIERRMAAVQVESLEEYVDLARKSEQEVQALFEDLLISVTSFFRDPVEFEALKPHITEIVREKQKGVLRAWIPGTATGEEAYSIAILFAEAIKEQGLHKKLSLQMFATDIDSKAIETARRGFYSRSALDQVPEELVDRYFDTAPSGYVVKKSLREQIVFSIHNIAQDPPFLNVDIISCRNLLIYFQTSLQKEVFNRFHYSLVPNGLLFLGKSEAVSASQTLFAPAGEYKHIFFQRPSRERHPPKDLTLREARPAPQPKVVRSNMEMQKLRGYQQQFESLVTNLGKGAILIEDNMTIVKAFGELGDYLTVSAGLVDTKISSLLRDPYRQDIQASVPGVIRNRTRSEGYIRFDADNPLRRIRVNIYPVDDEKNGEVMALAVFQDWVESASENNVASDENATFDELRNQISQLSNELAIAKTNLQQTVEELETSNEELQALNEELQSSNEELQSTNEEMETSNEELQSTNEELSTVNEELHVNAQQLSAVNLSLTSILDNVAIPLIVVDRNLNITNASGVAEEFFGIPTDIILPNVVNCKVKKGYPNLVDSLQAALDKREPMQWNINDEGQSATMKIVPHISAFNDLLGAIVLVNDNTEELTKARTELQLVFDITPVGLMVRDKEGVIIQANPMTNQLLESPDETLRGKSFYDLFDKEFSQALIKEDQDILNKNEPSVSEVMRAKYTNGKEKWVRVSRIPAEHPTKDEQALYSVTQDITEQYKAEQALKVSELRTDQAVRSANLGLWDQDFKTGEIFCSEQMMNILGIDEPISFEDSLENVHEDDRKALEKVREKHLNKNEPYDAVYRYNRPDGQQIWLQTNGQATRNNNDEVIRLTGTIRDITEEKEILADVNERKEQLELAAALSGLGYWRVDLEKGTVLWSEQVHNIHGTDPETYKPELETGIDFYHAEHKDIIEKAVNEAIEAGTGFNHVAKLKRLDGEIRDVHTIGTCHKDDKGKVVALFGVFLDITEEKKKQEALRKTLEELGRSNEELNRFSYVCSHDMKEPVRMIEAMANLLTDPRFDGDEQKRSDLLNRIGTNTSRLRGIIDSLLAYSRIDAKVDVENVDLNKTVSEVVESLSLAIKEQNAEVNLEALPTVRGAAVHFTQLFQNLIGNALKFSDKKKPVIRISTEEKEDGWQVLLEDNGPGIPEKSRSEVFTLFSRLQRRDEVDGTGLGLSIAQRIVMQYDGNIECVDSSLGGAAFSIFFPKKEKND